MDDQKYMMLAIELAKSTLGQTSPNPAVGAVVVKNNEIVGMGAHLKAGDRHAEVNAISMAEDHALGATLYVTLEPCSHHGKTPPCTNFIIQSGIERVVVATEDPNPEVSGKGLEALKAAGIQVEFGLLREEADSLNPFFYHYIKTGYPYVTLKTATSLDGKIATNTGESRWITHQEAREDVHYYRHIHDAILVGVNTVIKDNPLLTTRLPGGGKNPIRIILDHQLRTPLGSKLIEDKQSKTIIIIGKNVEKNRLLPYEQKKVEFLRMETETIILKELLKKLGEMEISSVLVEGGAEVHGSFLKEQAFQQVITYISPKLIGGRNAPTSFGGEGIDNLSDAVDLEIKEVKKLGLDVRIISVPKQAVSTCLQE